MLGERFELPQAVKPPDLQSGAIDRSANLAYFIIMSSSSDPPIGEASRSSRHARNIFPIWSRLSDSDRRPAVYKTAALPLS